MRPEKYNAVAQIVSTLLAKSGVPEQGARPNPTLKADGVSVRFEEGKVYLYDGDNNRMTLEELIQYVDRYLS
ncbi:MAG: hypothetical protein EP343_07260 [Deltaproteobacteria bacterium]|nr:MAG: hypothetical protein EP343_07260 [Deltaproteobacteria bacterium]